MAESVKDLCRLCGKKEEFTKDLLDENNKTVLKLIQDFMQFTITGTEDLPTKICLNCEEKMVSFQLFVLECYNVQEVLKKMCYDSCDNIGNVKYEDIDFGFTEIKSEVKEELLAEDVVSEVNDEAVLSDINGAELYDDDNDEAVLSDVNEAEVYDDNNDELDNVTIASLKRETKKKHKHIPVSKESMTKLKKILRKPGAAIKDFVNFKCRHCQKQCWSWLRLNMHSEKVHHEAPVVVCICGQILKSRTGMYKHFQDHKNPKLYRCDKCPRITKSLRALDQHKILHIPKSELHYDCNKCNKSCSTKEALKSHLKSHIPIEERKIYHCAICNVKFTTRSSAASHKRVVHDKIKSYVCDQCGYACGTSGELRQHRAIHSDDKPFVCNKCNKRFKTYSNLKTHIDTHAGTSYACHVCSRVLNSRRTLRKHLLVHEDKCRHVCSFCNKSFKRRQTLKVHMHSHTGDKPISCKWCDERFSYASTLRSHRLRCHPDKMAAQADLPYADYAHNTGIPIMDYMKNDVTTMAVTKNEEEAIL